MTRCRVNDVLRMSHCSACQTIDVQDWITISIQFGKKGQPDQAAISQVCISEEGHVVRSQDAVTISLKAAAAHTLPALAAGGGCLTADPNSIAQRKLTRGTRSIPAYICLFMSARLLHCA